MISFAVEGIPRPQGSKRHVGRGIMVESSKHVAEWRSWVRLKASQAMGGEQPLTGPVCVNVSFLFDRPKKHFNSKGVKSDAPEFKASKPDIDKLLRAVLDAMTGVVFVDDSQVVVVTCYKEYGKVAQTLVQVGQFD